MLTGLYNPSDKTTSPLLSFSKSPHESISDLDLEHITFEEYLSKEIKEYTGTTYDQWMNLTRYEQELRITGIKRYLNSLAEKDKLAKQLARELGTH